MKTGIAPVEATKAARAELPEPLPQREAREAREGERQRSRSRSRRSRSRRSRSRRSRSRRQSHSRCAKGRRCHEFPSSDSSWAEGFVSSGLKLVFGILWPSGCDVLF